MAQKRGNDVKGDRLAVVPHIASLGGLIPVVGIGASAGGLGAFEAFFSGMPKEVNPGIAFVLVQHLAPDHKSILTELVRRYTSLDVFEVEDGVSVKPNCAYIIPPNRNMILSEGRLRLLEPESARGQRFPIDFFFRSLAESLRERSMCVILSGTGSDGTLGMKAIKSEGGMSMVQSPDTTEYDGMPRSALATGLVDYELPPEAMPAKLMEYVGRVFQKSPDDVVPSASQAGGAIARIFALLLAHSGNDFSHYKSNTIYRRIERRMAMQQIATMEEYVNFLRQSAVEVEALNRDLLIGVTSFFRDPKPFAALENKAIATMLQEKPSDSVIRVWVPGCSTGEEPYTIAMLLAEQQQKLGEFRRVQIFATDIDPNAIAVALAGLYPASIVADVSPDRLDRFFTEEQSPEHEGPSSFRIRKEIRDMMIFSEQNVISDPPFSRLDLVSCRNLLIYMDGYLQKRLIPVFHYSLNPGGFLFLGTSESVGEFGDLFSTIDMRAKIFQRKKGSVSGGRPGSEHAVPRPPAFGLAAQHDRAASRPPAQKKLPLRELAETALLAELAPMGALVNAKGEVLYLHGRTGMFLEPAEGEFDRNILKMAREGLQWALTSALHRCVASGTATHLHDVRVRTNGDMTRVSLTVKPVDPGRDDQAGEKLYLVILQKDNDFIADGDIPSDATALNIGALRKELRAKEEYLQSAMEELETSNEQLRTSNEEMQSINEELQSANEELETSREELQSVNEELSTVNAELQEKIGHLSRSNNDMNNLLSGTGIATVFVDHNLRILRFTPTITPIINLISADQGRPVGHIMTNLLGYKELVQDVQSVLDTLAPKEVEVQTIDGKWYLMRIHPYRTVDNVIEGAVITFVNVSEIHRFRELLQEANDRLRLAAAVHDTGDAIVVHQLEGNITAWNPAAERIYGWSQNEALTMKFAELIPEANCREEIEAIRRLATSKSLVPQVAKRQTKEGRFIEVAMIATALRDESGNIYGFSTTERNVVVDPGA